MGLEIRLLGELEVWRDGARLPLPASKKARALLGYLIATARPHSRLQLSELLWEVPDDPRAAVRWCLTKIRPLIDDEEATRLNADREHVAFEAHGARVDLHALDAAIALGIQRAPTERLQMAARLFKGELLEGLDHVDCFRYHAWWVAEREARRRQRLEILSQLVDRLRTSPEDALAVARARVEIDPLSEASHVDVITLLDDLGRSKEALVQYDVCRRILEQELHSRPSPELERVRSKIGRPSTLPNPPPAPEASSAARRLPIIGRQSGSRRLRSFSVTQWPARS